MMQRFLSPRRGTNEDAAFVANMLRPDPKGMVVPLPDTLLNWLVDLALLKHVPFHYLVPDPDALPPESLRFFYVDNTWLEALIDGALAAGNVGILDQHLPMSVMEGVRKQVYARLRLQALISNVSGSQAQPTPSAHPFPLSGDPLQMTGFLLRSAAVRRWPEMSVRAFNSRSDEGVEPSLVDRVPVLRRTQLGPDLMLVLFAGAPLRLELEEPAQGLQFGVDGLEDSASTAGPKVTCRMANGQEMRAKMFSTEQKIVMTVSWKRSDKRTLDVENLHTIRNNLEPNGGSVGPGLLSLQLQQLPWCQVFQSAQRSESAQPQSAPATKVTPTNPTKKKQTKSTRAKPDPEEE